MVDWIRKDDFSRTWPEGVVVAFYPNRPGVGSGRAVVSWRDEDGQIDPMDPVEGEASHFFYMPEEPKL